MRRMKDAVRPRWDYKPSDKRWLTLMAESHKPSAPLPHPTTQWSYPIVFLFVFSYPSSFILMDVWMYRWLWVGWNITSIQTNISTLSIFNYFNSYFQFDLLVPPFWPIEFMYFKSSWKSFVYNGINTFL